MTLLHIKQQRLHVRQLLLLTLHKLLSYYYLNMFQECIHLYNIVSLSGIETEYLCTQALSHIQFTVTVIQSQNIRAFASPEYMVTAWFLKGVELTTTAVDKTHAYILP